MNTKQPILITAADRSGSSIVARIFAMCGAFTGDVSPMYEHKEIKKQLSFIISNYSRTPYMPSNIQLKMNDWSKVVLSSLENDGYDSASPFMYKDAGITQTWELWYEAFKDAKWIIVRRRTGDVIHSCTQTAYMDRFKHKESQKLVGANTEKEGWLWWVHQYEERFRQIINTTPKNIRVIWPERMAEGDFVKMREAVEWSGLVWNEEVEKVIPKLLRRNQNGR